MSEHSTVEIGLRSMIEGVNFESMIKKSFPGVEAVRKNPHLHRDSFVYTRFLSALVEASKLDSSITQGLFAASKSGSIDNLESLMFVFHGTDSHNIPSILQKGLLPSCCKSGSDFWVGKRPSVSAEYCKDASGIRKTMILFLELVGVGVDVPGKDARTIPKSHPEVLLPVAELDFRSH